jgi:hypothetical protein
MTRMSRTLIGLAAVLALTLSAAPAMAAGTTTGYGQTAPTTGYGQTAPTPSTPTPQTAPKPSGGTGPSKETATPKTTGSEPSSAKTTTPTSSSAASTPTTGSSRSTLPFTGLDLRWVLGLGVLLLGAGVSIRLVARRQRDDLPR